MTDNDNPTSPPWLQSHPAEGAGIATESDAPQQPNNDADGSEPSAAADANPADDTPETESGSGVGPADVTSVYSVNEPPVGADQFAGSGASASEPFAPHTSGQFAVPGQSPEQFAPHTSGQFAVPGQSPEQAAPHTSGQFAVPGQFPDTGASFAPPGQFPEQGSFAPPNQFSEQQGSFAPPGQFPEQGSFAPPNQFPDQGSFAPHTSGQFAQPGQFPEQGSGQFPDTGTSFAPPGQFPEQGSFAPPGGPFAPSGPFDPSGPGQFAPGPGQFPEQPVPGQFEPPAPGQFDHQPNPNQFEQAPNHGQFEQQAPGQFEQQHVSGQFTQPPGPGQFEQPGQFSDAGRGQFAQGGYAPPGEQFQAPPQTPEQSNHHQPTPDGGDPHGGAINSWAPPPIAPQQQSYQQPQHSASAGMGGGPSTGQYQTPDWQGGAPQGQQGQPQQQPFVPQHMPQPGQPGHSVNDLNLLKRARKAPRSGWRRAVHKASRGIINPGESAADVVHADLIERVNQPVRGDYRIAILSLKGGVGKTTTTVGIGSTFASARGDRVIAIDANPDLGTLAHRVPRQTRSTVRNLLEDQHITRYSDVRAHTSQAPSRLEVLASEQDPAVSEAFSEADYRKAIGILQSFYNIILTDCGTGLMHSAMSGVLDMASSLVLVTSPAIDGARSASATLDWLDHHGYSKLVERTVVVVNASRRGASSVDIDQLRKLFLDRTRAVQVVPFDDHLAEGAEIDLELVSKPTRRALLELAAMVADDFGYAAGQQPYGR
ncbi:MinD/ParA family ATP-binding protein [Nocardia cyriacigeorgica]|uniref:MinD/ParA family ATP-binding protein n=1 Tax=Nocardia cyriacigeorgica TaxID=135487 RepID=UPI00245777D9|nr:MinD/ParA family protein [Nocardia cyriacigeorgica]